MTMKRRAVSGARRSVKKAQTRLRKASRKKVMRKKR